MKLTDPSQRQKCDLSVEPSLEHRVNENPLCGFWTLAASQPITHTSKIVVGDSFDDVHRAVRLCIRRVT